METDQSETTLLTQIVPDKKHFSQIGFSYFLFAVIAVILQIALVFVLSAMKLEVYADWIIYLVAFAPTYLVALPALFLLLRRVQDQGPEKREYGAKQFIVTLIICFPIMWIGSLVGNVFTSIINNFSGNDSGGMALAEIVQMNPYLNLIFIGLLAPALEELVFRKMLIDRLYRYGEGIAVVTSGLMFGLFHGNFTQFFYATMLGMLFAYVYCKTGKLRYSIILHMVINVMGAVLAPFLLKQVLSDEFYAIQDMASDDPQYIKVAFEWLVSPGVLFLLLYLLAYYLLVIIGAAMLIIFRKKISFEKGLVTIQKGRRFSTVWLNIGMLLFVVACVGLFIYSYI